jgi:Mrp family chromosome partitioning ATPase
MNRSRIFFRLFSGISRPIIGRDTVRGFCSSKSDDSAILKYLSVIIDPDLNRDIVSLGFVKNLKADKSSGHVEFDLELTTPACPVKDQFVTACETVLKKNLNWVQKVNVTLTARARKSNGAISGGAGLSKVSNIIAVSSCKGGVGKSSIAYNLALALRRTSAEVGLLDIDIFGPSLPVFVPNPVKGPFDESMSKQVQVMVDPASGIKLMSMGYLRPGESIALRGPMVSGIAQQLLSSTGWGSLDYLVLDMPPGTSDIHLTIGQHAPIDAAVVVTTPHQLAVVDVEKGIEFLNKMKVPTVALVENFSFFKCPSCDDKHQLFGSSGSAKKVAEKFGIDSVMDLPIDPNLTSPQTKETFEALASTVVREIAKLKHNSVRTEVSIGDGVFDLTEKSNEQTNKVGSIPFRELRLACKSATMIDEWTGEKLYKDEDIQEDVKPVKIEQAGNYAYRIDWSDKHHSIFPIKAIRALIK